MAMYKSQKKETIYNEHVILWSFSSMYNFDDSFFRVNQGKPVAP